METVTKKTIRFHYLLLIQHWIDGTLFQWCWIGRAAIKSTPLFQSRDWNAYWDDYIPAPVHIISAAFQRRIRSLDWNTTGINCEPCIINILLDCALGSYDR